MNIFIYYLELDVLMKKKYYLCSFINIYNMLDLMFYPSSQFIIIK